MTDTWYYTHNDRRVGPLSLAGLKSGLEKIADRKDLLVWRNGFSEWQRADNVREILALFPPPAIPRIGLSESAEKSRWSIAKVSGGIALLAAVFMAGHFATEISKVPGFISPWLENKNTADIERVFADALVKMRAEIPKKIDDMTTLMWVSYERTKFIYENRVAIDQAKVDDSMKGKMSQFIFKNVCATAELRRLLNLGASFRYVYSDKSGKPVMTIDMAKQNCS